MEVLSKNHPLDPSKIRENKRFLKLPSEETLKQTINRFAYYSVKSGCSLV